LNAPILDARSSASVTFAVWEALFLREAVSRVSGGRGAWVWLLLEPVAQLALLLIFVSLIRGRTASGYDYALFLVIGILAYNLFKNTALQSMAAISANKALFTYRQVKPVDVVLVRAFLEGIIQLIVSIVLLTGMSLLGFDSLPQDPLQVFVALALLWVFGMGLGLVLAVGDTLIAELGQAGEAGVCAPVFLVRDLFLADHAAALRYAKGCCSIRLCTVWRLCVPPSCPIIILWIEVDLSYLAAFAFASFFLGLGVACTFCP
jgi:capsular polysaccharide transport system permease protein